jgi:hypothetical protein
MGSLMDTQYGLLHGGENMVCSDLFREVGPFEDFHYRFIDPA